MNQTYYIYSSINSKYLGEIAHSNHINLLSHTTIIPPPKVCSKQYESYFDVVDEKWRVQNKTKKVAPYREEKNKNISLQQYAYKGLKRRLNEGILVAGHHINSDFKALNSMKKLYEDLIRYTSNTYILFMVKDKTFILINQSLLLEFINEVETFLDDSIKEYFLLNRKMKIKTLIGSN